MLRRLSSFLGQTHPPSARQTDSVTEVLQLVAEHARELTRRCTKRQLGS